MAAPAGSSRTLCKPPPGHAAYLTGGDQRDLSCYRTERWPACGLLAGHLWAVWFWGGGPPPWGEASHGCARR